MDFWRTRMQQPDLSAEEEADVREITRRTTRLQVETHLQAATLLVRLDRKAEAIEHLDRVLQLAPTRANAYSRRAEILHELGRYEEAVPNIDEFLRSPTSNSSTPTSATPSASRPNAKRRFRPSKPTRHDSRGYGTRFVAAQFCCRTADGTEPQFAVPEVPNQVCRRHPTVPNHG